MLRRLLMSASNRFMDAHTLFFNDGTDLFDHGPQGVKISNNGNFVYVSAIEGEKCWTFPFRTVNGVAGTPYLSFAPTREMRLSTNKVLTIEYMFYAGLNPTGNMYMYSYGYDTNNYFFEMLIQNSNTLIAAVSAMNSSNRTIMPISIGGGYIQKKWSHAAITMRLDSNLHKLEYSAYYDKKYAGSLLLSENLGNIENTVTHYIGNNAGIALNNGITTGRVLPGIKNFRLSNVDRYKKRDYTPYVDN